MTTFAELGLAAPILRALEEAGYSSPTPIQEQSIPLVMAGRDLLGIAQTGTGKTAAFSLPVLHRLAQNPQRPPRGGCRVLVLSPTRELSGQIADNVRAYGKHLGFSVTTVFGGVPHRPQMRALQQGVDIVVATPGRLLDHMSAGTIRLDRVEVLVLDEADQMLDKGFLPAIRKVIPAVPKSRQTLFFSATMPTEIERLAADMLNDPAKVAVTPVATTAERVAQRVIHVDASRKRTLLADLLKREGVGRTLVFSRTKHGADRVAKNLELDGLAANAIHGNKSQGQRERALLDFRSGRAPILVATDIAARGIDVDGVTHVVQFDLPDTPESYVHRIGRTARAGASGEAIAFCAADERDKLRAVEKLIRQQIPAEDQRLDQSAPLTVLPAAGRGQNNRGRRPGGGNAGQGHGNRGRGAPGGGHHRNDHRADHRADAPRGNNGGQRKDRAWRDGDFRDSGRSGR